MKFGPLVLILAFTATMGFAQDVVKISDDGLLVSLTADKSSIHVEPDYLRARPMPLPRPPLEEVEFYLQQQGLQQQGEDLDEGKPGSVPGFRGTGETWPGLAKRLYTRNEWSSFHGDSEVEREAFGKKGRMPYSTTLVDIPAMSTPELEKLNLSSVYPFRATGKFFFRDIFGGSYYCSAAMVGKGILVTAAHCVVDNTIGFFYRNFRFVPAFQDGDAPYGTWNWEEVIIFTSYRNRSACRVSGIVCQNDIAVVVLSKKNRKFLGNTVGFFARGWNGFGYTPDEDVLITQLGYPRSHNRGQKMIRTDSQGARADDPLMRDNTVWGSSQTRGSSGGPGVVNFGVRTSGANGKEKGMNRVIQVTSWGYVNSAFKIQGASRFTGKTIVPLVREACAHRSGPC